MQLSHSHSLPLLSSTSMPLLGFGTWKLTQNCSQTVYQALKKGYRLLDCACDYGNEKEVGLGLKKAIQEGIVKREDVFLTSKLWNTFHRKEHVEAACRRSIGDLGVQYLDLYLIHFPISLKYVDPEERYPPQWVYYDNQVEVPCMIEDYVPIIQTWRAMEELVKKGFVKAIGVSNFGVSLLRDLLNSCTIKPSVLQIELHPYLTQKRLIKFTQSKKIQITAFSSFGGASYLQLGMSTAEEFLTSNQLIVSLSQKYSKTPSQILLRWAIQQNIAIIPKTSKVERLKQNADVFDWKIQDGDMEKIDGLNRNRRYNDPGVFCQQAFGTFFPIYE